jgi:DNA-binding XRE family transcriptional regulator
VGGMAASKLGIGKKTLIKKLEKIKELLEVGEQTVALGEVEKLLEKLKVEKPEDFCIL